MTPIIGYFLWVGDDNATLILVFLLILAGFSDYLDGYLARKLNRQTTLGLMLDPLADKIFVTILILELVFLRKFPIWLALMIFLRDLIILIGASRMIKRKDFIPSSINSGKYYFASLALLIASHVIGFVFGQYFCLYLTVILYIISSFEYARNFYLVIKGEKPLEPSEDPVYKFIRGTLTVIFSVIFLYKLFEQFFGVNIF